MGFVVRVVQRMLGMVDTFAAIQRHNLVMALMRMFVRFIARDWRGLVW